MKRLSRLLCAAGSVLGLCAASAQALPPILDRVPSNALIVISTPSLDQLEKGVQSLTTTLEMPPSMNVKKELLGMRGFDAGLDMTKSVAAVVMPGPAKAAEKKPADPNDPMAGDEPEEEPPIILLVPTGDYKALLKSAFNADAGAGITEFIDQDGNQGFAKEIGDGYAAIGNKKDVLEAFDGKGGNAKAHSERIGKAGNAIGEKADLIVIANIAALGPMAKPMIEQGITGAMEDSPLAMMGGEMNLDGLKEGMDAFFDQATGAVIALDIEPSGVSFDVTAQFKPGTELAQAFGEPGNSSALIGKLPNQPYLLNYAIDVSKPSWKKLIKDTMAQEAMAEMPTTFLIANIDNTDGMAQSVGFSQNFFAGLLVNTSSYYKTSKPAELVAGAQKMLETLNGKSVAGTDFATTYSKGAAKVNNVDVDVWEMTMTPGADGDPASAQIPMMLFGPTGGPGGFIAPVEGGVVTTLAKNQLLMAASMDAAGKGTNSMGDDAMTKQVGERLPKGRLAEGYIGVKSIMESVKPLLQMAGAEISFDVPDQLPPVGAGVGAGDSAGHMGLFIPMPVIKTVGAALKSAQAGMGGGGPAPAAQPGQPAGQPRF